MPCSPHRAPRRRGQHAATAAVLALLTSLVFAGRALAADAGLERGRYLVTTILACGNCHTPKAADGTAIPGRELAGGGLTLDLPSFAGSASNITPDRETGIGSWSRAEIKAAITGGVRPDHGRLAGIPLGLPMWINFYKALVPDDLEAVVTYLQSLPAVHNPVALPVYRARPGRDPYPDAERGFVPGELADPVRRGAYLATIGHCMECHTPLVAGKTQYESALGAGGRAFAPGMVKGLPAAWTGSVSRNITAHPDAGIGRWTDAEIRRAIARGIGRDGRILQAPMPYAWYAGLTDADLDALVAWLRTVAPRP